MAEIYRDGELWLYGYVGDAYWDEGFTASEVLAALALHGREQDITVHVNSGGGNAYDGIAIYNALSAHKGKVRVEIDAIAASAASVLAMGGDHIVMRPGSLMMIHDPSGITIGTAEDHEKQRVALNKLADQGASIYAERSGGDPGEIREKMKEELWLTADEAVEQGFADEAEGAKAKPVSAFDYRLYQHAPQQLQKLAAKKNWRLPDADEEAAKSAAKRPKQEIAMTDKERADQLAAENATLKAQMKTADDAVKADRERRAEIMALEETKGREKLAERLATLTMSIEDVKATLADAPTADAAPKTDAEMHQERRLNGEGLGGRGTKPGATMRVDIVADMKRRHGVK
ncbi:ATP-dependent Clp protease proteolytic subunit [Tianweitania sp. BSSL-BM11]|uniref:ATP-dependent Clp protease proteolytic subunit n=1 Tax=Tianweitania aestuarii TaxID=2814886 RepID=A0ABS5RT73_9HYPH|nr:head maturation protease, ClpP-related [Tianweitania aestuarii]MBS9720184.1 ATP-dependent Clp protease proteolytic subunit [Tianweitania aestuarii]